MNAIRSIGLYRNKARSLKALSESLVSHFDGVVPSSRKELMSLAGVGRKTANVVRSVCFDIPSFAVDTHVERVSKRLGLAKPQDDVLKVEEKLRRKIDPQPLEQRPPSVHLLWPLPSVRHEIPSANSVRFTKPSAAGNAWRRIYKK